MRKPQFITEATLEDGSSIEIEIYGEGPTLLLPVNPHPIEGPLAEEIRKYGADPALGQNLIQGLSDVVRVVAFDYEGHVMSKPRPDTLTPANIVKDFLTIADAAKTDHFAYYGYSWLAMSGLQLAIRTNRLSALIMGGFPPLHGPYTEMLRVTAASYDVAGSPPSPDDEWSGGLTKDQAQQYLTLYQSLQDFDDEAVQAQITCPRLCFVGSADEIQYGKNWGDVFVSLAGPIIRGQAELEALGWEVRVLEGLDHMGAMQAAQVVPMLRSWLATVLHTA
jgi:pimeloyl-ACP methyl ester carboxylesterase